MSPHKPPVSAVAARARAAPVLSFGSLRDKALRARDRLLASETFRSRAAAFPLTRWVARRRADDLFDLCAGFVYSQTLLACVETRIFDKLVSGPRALDELTSELSLPRDAARRLLQAAAALRLVELRGRDRYGLGPLGSALANNPGLTAMIEHHRNLYEDLFDPVALLRDGSKGSRLSRYWAYSSAPLPENLDDADVAPYSRLMSLSQPLVADEVLDVYAIGQHDCLMDVGGGEGAFLAHAADRDPDIWLKLFDLPAVAERGRLALERRGLAARVDISSGDFLRDELPKGADLITLIRILLDHDDISVVKILRACHAALPVGGKLLIAEPLNDPRGDRVGAAYFGMYLFAMGRGRTRSEAELCAHLRAAGFAVIERRTGRRVLRTGVLIATK